MDKCIGTAYLESRITKATKSRGTKPVWLVLAEYELSEVLHIGRNVVMDMCLRAVSQGDEMARPLVWVLDGIGRELSHAMMDSDVSDDAVIKLGAPVVDALVAEGFLTHESLTSRGKGGKPMTYNTVMPNSDVALEVYLKATVADKAAPHLRPPQRWESPEKGRKQLIHNATASAKLVASQPQQMPDVFTAVNALQGTAFKVNERVVAVMAELDEQGIYGVVPEPCERPDDWSDVSFYKRDEVLSAIAKRQRFDYSMVVAEKYKGVPHYYDSFCDYRGRFYYDSIGLNPQGDDFQRSILECANPKVMGKSAVKWLEIHVANCAGHDKLLLEDRVSWTKQNRPMIEAIASDPIASYDDWCDADKPVAFLAACMAYSDYLADPDNYRCPVFIAQDATLSCLQFLSAMTKDSTCAVECNLTDDNSEIGDFYRLITSALQDDSRLAPLIYTRYVYDDDGKRTNVTEIHRSEFFMHLDESGKEGLSSRDWRLIGKALVMLPLYSSQEGTVSDKILTDLKKKGGDYARKVKWRDALEMTRLAYDLLRTEAPGPWSVLNTLLEIGKQANDGLSFTSPTGFPVDIKPMKMTKHRIRVNMDSISRVTVQRATGEVNKSRVTQAVTANLIHALDAALMTRVLARLHKEGVNSFLMVHDSFAVPPAHCEKLFTVVREEFIKLMQEVSLPSIINGFKSQLPAGHKPLTESIIYGDFDVQQVIGSEFFIS